MQVVECDLRRPLQQHAFNVAPVARQVCGQDVPGVTLRKRAVRWLLVASAVGAAVVAAAYSTAAHAAPAAAQCGPWNPATDPYRGDQAEAVMRLTEIPEAERRLIAKTIGVAALRYADLSSNRTMDYTFSWEKLLAFEGNTAPYLLYAVVRVRSIFRKTGLAVGQGEEGAADPETPTEIALARKLLAFTAALDQALEELRPHHLCTYLHELASAYGAFYAADSVLVDDPAVKARRLMLCARTAAIMETGLRLLGIEPLERM